MNYIQDITILFTKIQKVCGFSQMFFSSHVGLIYVKCFKWLCQFDFSMETNSILFHVQSILKMKNLLTTKLSLMPRMLLKNSVLMRSQLQQIISPTSLVKVVLDLYTREIFQMVLRWLLRCYQTHHNKDHKNFLMRYVISFHLDALVLFLSKHMKWSIYFMVLKL